MPNYLKSRFFVRGIIQTKMVPKVQGEIFFQSRVPLEIVTC